MIKIFVITQPPAVKTDVANAEAVTDPEEFVRLTAQLLSIFPNGANVTKILDPNTNNRFVSKDDALIISDVVPKLRRLLAATPLEQERRARHRERVRLIKARARRLAAAFKMVAFEKLGY